LTSDFAVNIRELLTDKTPEFTWLNGGVTLGVVVASKGYPGDYVKGAKLPEKTSGNIVTYYAGVVEKAGQLVANGGRVYLLATTADSVSSAQRVIYEKLREQNLTGLFYRKDIGNKAND
jgi:phosphoribosylamine--glycine ligase